MGHFSRFIETQSLFNKEDELLVTVSGGIDSMVLLFALVKLQSYGYSNHLRAIHINHNTRVGQAREAVFVKEYCEHLGVDYTERTLDELNPNQNFEHQARLKRYDSFYEVAKKNELILLAHHIDDSFEWSMLQSLRSSSIEGLVGIPVKNNRVIRPFMCVSKAQIKSFAQLFDIPYINDPTNEQIKYERNFIRNEVISAFKDRHPKYLKHYVYRHNEIARRLGVHQSLKNKSNFHISLGQDTVLIYNLGSSEDYSGVSRLVLKAIKYLNHDSRGSLSKQLDNIEQALKNRKVGPLNLVGKFKAYLDHGLVLITAKPEKQLKLMHNEYQNFNYEEFSNYLSEYVSDKQYHMDFPFIVFIKGSNLDKRQFKISFNTDNLNDFRQENTVYYPALKLLRVWSKKQNRHRVLRLNFLTSV